MIETEKGRREFLKGTAWMGLAAVAAGCMGRGMKLTCGSGAPMQGWADKPMDVVRIGIVGFGHRGLAGARRLAVIPGAEGDSLNAYTYAGTLKAKGECVHGTASTDDDWQTITFTEDD